MNLFTSLKNRAHLQFAALAVSAGFAATACCPAPIVRETTPKIVDQDGDGVADGDDKCPAAAGQPEFAGCPDTDGDTVADDTDRCVSVAGTVEDQGCPPPDSDGDGVIDAQDACANVSGIAALGGCPDKDGDGVKDGDDKCIDQAGSEADGCLSAALMPFSGPHESVAFDKNKASLKKASMKVLDDLAAALAPTALRVTVTDRSATEDGNDKAKANSSARAEAVKSYLVGKGIDAGRIDVATASLADAKAKATVAFTFTAR
jgi:outer membrane protein OmpA-like peptidoglycan-associated protein